LKAIIPTEHQEQAALFSYAKLKANQDPRWGMMFAIPNQGSADKGGFVRQKIMKVEGQKPGVPDIFLAVPLGVFHGLFIEMKRVKNSTTSSDQKAWITALNKQGYCARVCKGFEQAKMLIESYLGLEDRISCIE
jgi:hypothetical protein